MYSIAQVSGLVCKTERVKFDIMRKSSNVDGAERSIHTDQAKVRHFDIFYNIQRICKLKTKDLDQTVL